MSFEKTPQNVIDDLFTILEIVVSVFDRNSIPYRAIAGTLLGAVRHGGLIPWDDDVDLAVFNCSTQRWSSAIRQLNSHTLLRVVQEDVCTKISLDNRETSPHLKGSSYPFLDVFHLFKLTGTKLHYSSKVAREIFPHEHIEEREWNTMRILNFSGIPLPVFDAPSTQSYLQRMYGHDYLVARYQTWDHTSWTPIEKSPEKIQNFDAAAPSLEWHAARS